MARNRKHKKAGIGLIAVAVILLLVLTAIRPNNNVKETTQNIPTAIEETQSTEEVIESESAAEESQDESVDYGSANQDNSSIEQSRFISTDDNAYSIAADNIPAFTEEEKRRTDYFEYYSELDSLGRCGIAFANICEESMPTEERGSIGMIKPSGWHTVKYNDLIDGNYLYNRCHLIGYQLAGENANEKNLITGTRYLNVIGMLPFENMVADYVESTGNHVLYRVTPIFEGNNLVATEVQMEAWSVEDQGKGVCFNVLCHNIQPGIVIDYSTGDSYEDTSYVADEEQPSAVENYDDNKENIDINTEEGVQADYVLNKNTHKIHLPSCSSVSDMKEKNKKYFTGTIEELMNSGYSPCQRCLGEYSNH